MAGHKLKTAYTLRCKPLQLFVSEMLLFLKRKEKKVKKVNKDFQEGEIGPQ